MEIWTLIVKSNTFNFVLLLLILIYAAKKMKIEEKIASAQEKVKETIEKSIQTKESSIKELLEANEKVKNVKNEILEIEQNGEKNIELLKNKIENETNIQLNNIQDNAQKIINSDNKQTVSSLSKQTALAAYELAKEHIKQILQNKPQYHQKFIDESIEELETGLK